MSPKDCLMNQASIIFCLHTQHKIEYWHFNFRKIKIFNSILASSQPSSQIFTLKSQDFEFKNLNLLGS